LSKSIIQSKRKNAKYIERIEHIKTIDQARSEVQQKKEAIERRIWEGDSEIKLLSTRCSELEFRIEMAKANMDPSAAEIKELRAKV